MTASLCYAHKPFPQEAHSVTVLVPRTDTPGLCRVILHPQAAQCPERTTALPTEGFTPSIF